MRFYTKRRRMPQVIIVSLIDIFAILLIFVIVTTTFKKEEPSVPIQLPESKTAVATEKMESPVLLSISADEQIFLDAQKVTMEELKPAIEKLVKENSKQTLALKADTKAPFGTVIRVLDVLRDAGVKGNLSALMESQK